MNGGGQVPEAHHMPGYRAGWEAGYQAGERDAGREFRSRSAERIDRDIIDRLTRLLALLREQPE